MTKSRPIEKSVYHPKVGDTCVFLKADWPELKQLKLRSAGTEIVVGPLLDVLNSEPDQIIPQGEECFLVATPYSLAFRRKNPSQAAIALWVSDLMSSCLRGDGAIEARKLIALVAQKSEGMNTDFIELCLKCAIAAGSFIVNFDKRKSAPAIYIELSVDQKGVEQQRVFAGTLASELSRLSDRVRSLIQHTSTVGTYRENLLQTLLRKHLPERYHVATGFIHPCPRQIDVLIYDRIDYAPIFREEDLVVVPPEAVRAVIEVKTDLSKAQLQSSLALIEEVSFFDDCHPPFFKGVFGFESKLPETELLQAAVNFYMDEPSDVDENGEFNFHPITQPYQHLTSICVLEHVYGEVQYERDVKSGQFLPVLYSRTSATGLSSQVSHFLELLLSYLRFGGLKPFDTQTMSRMLGADTQMRLVAPLTEVDWGPYFGLAHGISEDDAHTAADAEQNIQTVKAWVRGH
jgi:hypothetical protein